MKRKTRTKVHKCLPFKFEVGQRVTHCTSEAYTSYIIAKRTLIEDETGVRLLYALIKAPGEWFLAQQIELKEYQPLRPVEEDDGTKG
jgi:hypothetical protein